MRLIAIQEMWYAGRTRNPGDEFECPESDARFFTATDLPGGQKARVKPEVKRGRPPNPKPEPEQPPAVETRDMTAEQNELPERTPMRRVYRRRDMTPEE